MHKHFHTKNQVLQTLMNKCLSQNVPLPKQNERSQKVCEFFYLAKCAFLEK